MSPQAKIEKRSKRNLYEGSKLLDQHRKQVRELCSWQWHAVKFFPYFRPYQQTYEEMFMKINPLDAAAASKNKSKDVHLTNIDVNFGSNRILYVYLSHLH